MHIERLQTGHQGPLCTGYHQVVSDAVAAASRSQDRGWVVGGRLGGEEERVQIGMFPQETEKSKKRGKEGEGEKNK